MAKWLTIQTNYHGIKIKYYPNCSLCYNFIGLNIIHQFSYFFNFN